MRFRHNHNGGLIRPYSGIFSELLRAFDVLIVFCAIALITWFFDLEFSDNYIASGLAAMICFLFVSQLAGLYGSWRIAGIEQEIRSLLLVWVGVVFLLLLLAYASKVSATYSRRVFLTWIFLTPVFLVGFRILLRQALKSLRLAGKNTRTAAIAGSGELAERVKNIIETSPWLGLRLIGNFDDSADTTSTTPEHSLHDLINRTKNREVDVIFLVMSADQQKEVELLTTELADTTATLYYVPGFFLTDLMHSKWGYIEEIPYLSLREAPFYGVDSTFKRLEDVVLSTLILLLVCIPMLIIAVSIKLTSKGPVLFKQRRYGLDGHEIEVWKFRTMNVMEDGDHIPQAQPDDERLTPNGAFLRRTSLDELPQFLNVLSGQMSIVGPRPHAVAHNEEYRKLIYGYMLRHKVKPGITGWAQINGWRGQTDTLDKMEKRVDHDIWYIRNWSLWLDIKIIFLTIVHVLTTENAH